MSLGATGRAESRYRAWLSLLPATAAALRASLGAAQPYAILPAVWFCSAAGLAAGVGSSFLYRRIT